MRLTLIAFVCIALAPFVFGQSQSTDTAKTRGYQKGTAAQNAGPDTAAPVTSKDVVAVSSFTPGSSISVSATPVSQPAIYRLNKDAQYVDQAGKPIDPSLIRPGTRVRLEVTGQDRHVGRIVVIQPE